LATRHYPLPIIFIVISAPGKYCADVACTAAMPNTLQGKRVVFATVACYSQVLQFNPKEPGLWIEAASHEFFKAGAAARVFAVTGTAWPTVPAMDLRVQYFDWNCILCKDAGTGVIS
jgi:hypothetical protein